MKDVKHNNGYDITNFLWNVRTYPAGTTSICINTTIINVGFLCFLIDFQILTFLVH